jgi:hypothetical protein
VFVGYDRCDLDDEIGFRLQAGHFEVDPNEIFWRFHCHHERLKAAW